MIARHHDGLVEPLEPRGHQPDDAPARPTMPTTQVASSAPEAAPWRRRRSAARVASSPSAARARASSRHEGLREGAFGEEPAQQVRDAERDVEGVERRAGAEQPTSTTSRDEPGDARGEREQGDGRRGAKQVHGCGRRRSISSRARRCYTRGLLRGALPRQSPFEQRKTPLMATATKAKKKTVRIASGRKRARQDVKLNAANTAAALAVPHRHQERAEGRSPPATEAGPPSSSRPRSR